MGADDKRPLIDAAGEYVKHHYPEAYEKAHSLPEEFILEKKEFMKLHKTARIGEQDVNMPAAQLSVAMVFDKVKETFKGVPSLTLCDYAFTDTLLKGIKQQQKEKFINNFGVKMDDLASGDHDVFGVGVSGDQILGVFFQVKGTQSDKNAKTILKNLKIGLQQIQKDVNIFRTMCGEFLNLKVKLAGFAAFPMLSKSDLRKAVDCDDCRKRTLTSDDLDTLKSFEAFLKTQDIVLEKFSNWGTNTSLRMTFKEIFDFYVSAASFVDLPRNPTQYFQKSEEQIRKMLLILTPTQKALVKSEENIILICGASGTGKTFVLKKRAERLAGEVEVLVINIAGGLLTEEFRSGLKENKNIDVVDGKTGGLEEDLGALKKYLEEKGKGKHIFIDEVPITLGFQGTITSQKLSEHWKWIVDMIPHVKSITLCFRPNDQSYKRDFPLQDIKFGDYQMTVLEGVKRNSRRVAELFLAIGDYSRRIFISREKTLPLEMKQSGKGFIPVLFPIPSCFSIHLGECKNEKICEAVRASHAINVIYEEYSKSQEKTPLFVVVDHEKRRNALVNVFTSLYPSLPLLFPNFNRGHKSWDFRRNGASEGTFFIIVVTESEIIGCHFKNVTVVIDIAQSEWRNYIRLIATTGENKIIVVEDEQLRTGKFSRIIENKYVWKNSETQESLDEHLKVRLSTAWEKWDVEKIDKLKNNAFPLASLPEISIDWDGREGEEERDVDLMQEHWLTGIFGPPASGKSRRVNMFMQRVAERGARAILFQPERVLSLIEHQRRWGENDNVDLKGFHFQVKSFQELIKLLEVTLKEEKEMRKREKKKGDKGGVGGDWDVGSLTAIVEDCPLFEDLQGTAEKVKEMNIRLILAFKPHSEKASGDAVPTWDEVGKRLGEEAVKKEGILIQDMGKIICLSEETWAALNRVLPLPKDSSPFFDWGYAWDEWAGEAPTVKKRKGGIIEFL
ncbi:unnamed protein product, partial [Darwinula stevensoni]